MKELRNGSITSPLGFKTNAIYCGLKKKKPDLVLIYSIIKANAAAVFTTSKVRAAHIEIDEKNLKQNSAQAVIVNSGNANCCTGRKGKLDALKIVAVLAKELKLKKEQVLIASTGVIGKFLPLGKILPKISALVKGLGFDKAELSAKGIMTTDTFSKQVAVEIKLKGKRVTIAAIAKGAGMICPDMATMLCFITTDALINKALLKAALKEAVEDSFNCISVDGQMSTNDTVIILANGLAGNSMITNKSKEFKIFKDALKYVCLKLAKLIIKDAEGATKIIKIEIKNAKTRKEAKQAAQAVANSLLVKTMIAGENPNWGRIPASVGASGVCFKEEKLEVFLQGRAVYRNARPVLKDNEMLISLMRKKEIGIGVKLNSGRFNYTMWASDLTQEYVKINTEYS